MATVKKHTAKNGKVTYYIRVYDGYSQSGKQIERSMTWKPPDGLTPKQIEKELNMQIVKFEESVSGGTFFREDTRCRDYSETWLRNNKPQLAPKTFERYASMLQNINQAIGNIRLTKLQSHHLQEFYNNLREDGIKQVGTYACADNLREVLKERHLTHEALANRAAVSKTTVSTACKPGAHISIECAEKIAAALQMPTQKLFHVKSETTGLSDKTILHHHRLISAILAQAARDRLVPFNVADKNYMRAPKLRQKEAAFLDDEQLRQVLELLEEEPLKWKVIFYLLIFSGIRRGELLGLEWKDIDFEHRVIHIRRTSQYVREMGIITKSPKNDTSCRTIKLSEMMFDLLREYQSYRQQLRTELGSLWQEQIQIIHADGTQELVTNDRLFVKEDSTPMHPDSVTDWTRKFVEKNNLPHFTPHSLRHSHATLLIAEGVSIPAVSRRLGHSSVATTSRIYVHAIQSADEIASDLIDGKLNPHKK